MIRAIIFDCFGVLTTDLWKEFVRSLPELQREPARELNRAYDRGHLSRAEFVREVKQVTGRQPNEVEKLLDDEIYKNSELLDYIAVLKAQYKIGLLSNIATGWVRDVFLTSEEQGLFDAMVFSFEVGATKPDPKMYETVAGRLNVPHDECVMVDDIEHYCQAAESLGMKSVQYREFDQFKSELTGILQNEQ